MPAVHGRTPDDEALLTGERPVIIGALADDTSPDSVDEGDVGMVAMTLAREMYATPRGRGAGEVQVERLITANPSTTRADAVAAIAGTQFRIVSVQLLNLSSTSTFVEIYFGDGANITSTTTKAIAHPFLDGDLGGSITDSMMWPDGGGPIGAAGDQISIRTNNNVTTNAYALIVYRAE